MQFRELRGLEIGDVMGPREIAPGLFQNIVRAPNGWVWVTRDIHSGNISSVFVPEKRFRKRIVEGVLQETAEVQD